jgi:hypothetical protein
MVLAIAVAIHFFVGCGNSGQDGPGELTATQAAALSAPLPAASYTITITTPKQVSPQQVVLGASDSIQVNAGATVTRPGSLLSTITNTGAHGVALASGSIVGNVESDSLVLTTPGAIVKGGISVPSPSAVVVAPGATISGQVNTSAVLTPSISTQWTVNFPAATVQDVATLPLVTTTIAPGRFGNVVVVPTAKLALSAGVYYFESLTLSPTGTLSLNQTNGPVIAYVRGGLAFGGNIASTTGDPPDFLLAYLGPQATLIASPFAGTLVSLSAPIALAAWPAPHMGAFFAPDIILAAGATVSYRPASQLLVAAQPKNIQACVVQVQVPDGLTGEALEDAYQTAIARYCTAKGQSACTTSLIGRANVDYATAAQQLISQTFSPAQYIALSRDREAKLLNAKANPTLANSICTGPDADDDWVPDAVDKCPGTPPLTATDATGCPLGALPAAPSAAAVHQIIRNSGVMTDPYCTGAPQPSAVSGAALWQTAAPSNGMFIVSTAVTNQPVGCSVFYLFEIRVLDPNTGAPTQAPFMVAFQDTEAVANVGNLSFLPVISSSAFVQFVALSTQTGSRAQLAALAGQHIRMSFRVQAINGAGMRSPWSDWKEPAESDCLALGVFCAQQ